MTEATDNDADVIVFDSILNGADTRATIKFAKPTGPSELHYFLNERRVERADFEVVLAASRTLDADIIADALGEEGWVTVELIGIHEELKPEIKGSLAEKLIDALAER